MSCGARSVLVMDDVVGSPHPHRSPAGSTSTVAREAARLAALHGLGVLDTAPEERFDRIVALARVIFEVPVAAITLIDADRQWIKAGGGMASGVPTARDHSPCHYTVQHPGPLVITDTAVQARVADMTVVRQGIRFYAGQPLRAPTGERVGSLCIMDTAPRRFTAPEQEVLAELGQLVEWELAADGELEVAAAAQRALLPPGAVQVPGYEVAGRCTPARRAVGSYFDWHQADGRLQLQVADVLGAGAVAPTIAACLRILLRTVAQDGDRRRDTDRAAAAIGALLGETGTFVTAFAATLDPATGTLSYVLAGHGLAMILSPDGSHHRLGPAGPALGLSSTHGTGWQVRTTTVAPDQTLLVLGDGFLALDPDPQAQDLIDQTLEQVAQRYRGGIEAHQAVEVATAWAVAQDHPIDITALAVHRIMGEVASPP